MSNLITKGLLISTFVATALSADVKRPNFFNHLPQDTLFVAQSNNLSKGLDLYKDTQLVKELSEIKFQKILEQLATSDQKIDKAAIKELFNKENTDLFLSLLDSSFALAVLKPNLTNLDYTDVDFQDKLAATVLSSTILQWKPKDKNTVNTLIKKFKPLLKKNYSQKKLKGYVVNQFKIDKVSSYYILEKSGVYTFTITVDKTIKLLDQTLTKNMNNLKSMNSVYTKAQDSTSFVNMKEVYKILSGMDDSVELKSVLASLEFINEYLMSSNINLKEKSETSTLTTQFNNKIPSYIKKLVKNNGKKSEVSKYFNKDTAFFSSFSGLSFKEIVDYFVAQNDIKLDALLKSDPKLKLMYNKLQKGLGQEYALSLSGVKPGLIPIPLGTLAIEVKSEKIMKEIIQDLLLSKSADSPKPKTLTKVENGTKITTVVSPVPGMTPAYMFYKNYLFISTDPASLIKVLNLSAQDSLQANQAFVELASSGKAQYQKLYINGHKLFGTIEGVLKNLSPLLAQKPEDKVLVNDLILPVLKALKNIKTIANFSEATSEKAFKTTTKAYIK